MNLTSQAKREVRQREREAHKRERAEQWREIKCFWTWPLGHAYENRQCVNCRHWYRMNL